MTEIIYLLIATHITIVAVTIYLHRFYAHRALFLHPILQHFFRVWLWLTTGMRTHEWVAIHRLHHQKVDRAGDPHSPKLFGIKRVLFGGVLLYRDALKDEKTIDQLSSDRPKDLIENLYKHSYLGVSTLLVSLILIFGWVGILLWAVQMIWIPFWAAGVINGIGHHWGYRNTETEDTSKNIIPIGLIIGGEELHNNHHRDPTSPKFSMKWWEFDIGWFWIQIFRFFGLAILRPYK